MRDLRLWHDLAAAELPATAQLVPALLSLAELPLGQRFPYFGRLERVLGDPEPQLRAAAARVLRGAEGTLTYPTLVKLLDDADQAVRGEALSSLLASASLAPALGLFSRLPATGAGSGPP